MKNFKKFSIFLFIIVLLLTLVIGVASAANTTKVSSQKKLSSIDKTSQIETKKVNVNNTDNKKIITKKKTLTNEITKKNISTANKNQSKKTSTTTNAKVTNKLKLELTVKNATTPVIYDTGNETAITKNITLVNGKPDISQLGIDYAYADEEGVYTITSAEILRVRQLDSYCQQIYGFTPKYTFFRTENSNIKYIISREKWNVITRSLSKYHVNQGFNAVNPPYKLTINLSGKVRYTPIYFDYQEWINGERYTCGPTSMSMISQGLNIYSSEKKLSGVYGTTSAWGTDETSIIKYSPNVNMKLTNIANTKESVKSALQDGCMIFWHISGHYMAIAAYNNVNDTFLCLNPSGPSHNINAVQWATWSQVTNTDRPLKENGFMKVTPYYTLTDTIKEFTKFYYYNMGGKYTAPANSQYANTEDNPSIVTIEAPEQTSTSTVNTKFEIKSYLTSNNKAIKNGRVLLYLNKNLIASPLISNGMASFNYQVPIASTDNIKLTAKYANTQKSFKSKAVKITFNPTVNATYTKEAKIGSLETLYLKKITAKYKDNVTFDVYVQDASANIVNGGYVFFKINGKTLTKNSKAVKVKVENSKAQLKFKIPAWSAKKYNITAIYYNKTTRLEKNNIILVKKTATKIVNLTKTQSKTKVRIKAKIIDHRKNIVKKPLKATIKVNSKVVYNKITVKNGKINKVINLSKYKKGKYKISVIIAETGIYKATKKTIKVVK
ncbi:MAG: C39 family peptidase [Methanosphaera sp.]|nr:C39 family peptidase [Methanosphaera sp.]